MNTNYQGKLQFDGYIESLTAKREEYEKSHPEKIEFEYQEVGLEMKKHFNKNLFWLFHQNYTLEDIKAAFAICKKRGINNHNYLLGVLKNRRNRAF